MDVEKKKNNSLLLPDIILGAVEGREEALQEVLSYYDRLVHAKFQYITREKGINISYMPLADMKQETRAELVEKIKKFVI